MSWYTIAHSIEDLLVWVITLYSVGLQFACAESSVWMTFPTFEWLFIGSIRTCASTRSWSRYRWLKEISSTTAYAIIMSSSISLSTRNISLHSAHFIIWINIIPSLNTDTFTWITTSSIVIYTRGTLCLIRTCTSLTWRKSQSTISSVLEIVLWSCISTRCRIRWLFEISSLSIDTVVISRTSTPISRYIATFSLSCNFITVIVCWSWACASFRFRYRGLHEISSWAS